MSGNSGRALIENLSQGWTDGEVLSFLHSCPQMLKNSFCFRTMMAYIIRPAGGDEICMLYIPENPKEALLICLARSDSSKGWGDNNLVPRITYYINVTMFDFEGTFLGLKYAIQKEKEERNKQSHWKIDAYQALAILFRKGARLIEARQLLSGQYEKKCYWSWVKKLISYFQKENSASWRNEQIFLLLDMMYKTLDERLYDLKLNDLKNLKFFAG